MPETNFFWDDLEDNIVEEYDGSGTTLADYTTEADYFGNVISQYRNDECRCFHYEAIGSTLALTNESQVVTDSRAYSGFGETTESNGVSSFPFQYIGQRGYYRDASTGQLLVRAREYAPNISRWNSVDAMRPIGGSGYDYVLNNPVLFNDPSGLVTLSSGVTVEFGMEAYEQWGAGLTLAFTYERTCCIDALGAPGLIHSYTAQLRGEIGIGYGYEIKVLGRTYGRLWKLAAHYISYDFTCDAPCGTGTTPQCCRICRETGIDLPGFVLFEKITISHFGGVTIQGTFNGNLRACFSGPSAWWAGAFCPIGFAVGFCGHITYSIWFTVPFGTGFGKYGVVRGCYPIVGSAAALGY